MLVDCDGIEKKLPHKYRRLLLKWFKFLYKCIKAFRNVRNMYAHNLSLEIPNSENGYTVSFDKDDFINKFNNSIRKLGKLVSDEKVDFA